MKMCYLGWLVLASAMFVHAAETSIPTVERDGRIYVRASLLANQAGIAIKRLPGRNQIVACSENRCALIPESISDKSDTLIPVTVLADAFGAKAEFSARSREIRFQFDAGPVAQAKSPGVGQLAPNFRLTKLDGTSVALSDFRGRRVIINSWASW